MIIDVALQLACGVANFIDPLPSFCFNNQSYTFGLSFSPFIFLHKAKNTSVGVAYIVSLGYNEDSFENVFWKNKIFSCIKHM